MKERGSDCKKGRFALKTQRIYTNSLVHAEWDGSDNGRRSRTQLTGGQNLKELSRDA